MDSQAIQAPSVGHSAARDEQTAHVCTSQTLQWAPRKVFSTSHPPENGKVTLLWERACVKGLETRSSRIIQGSPKSSDTGGPAESGPGSPAASRSWRSKGTDCPLEARKERSPAGTSAPGSSPLSPEVFISAIMSPWFRTIRPASRRWVQTHTSRHADREVPGGYTSTSVQSEATGNARGKAQRPSSSSWAGKSLRMT